MTTEKAPARAERDAEHAAFMKSIEPVDDAIQAAKIAAKGERGIVAIISCPTCGGSLQYRVAHNGHTSGRCLTDGCAEWRE